jgi:hypothetical protein
MRPSGGQFFPFLVSDSSKFVQDHHSIFDVPEEMPPVFGANGNEISAALAVIVSPQPNGAAVMNFRVEFHGFCAFPVKSWETHFQVRRTATRFSIRAILRFFCEKPTYMLVRARFFRIFI